MLCCTRNLFWGCTTLHLTLTRVWQLLSLSIVKKDSAQPLDVDDEQDNGGDDGDGCGGGGGGGEWWLQCTKLTGDTNVPAGQLSWEVRLPPINTTPSPDVAKPDPNPEPEFKQQQQQQQQTSADGSEHAPELALPTVTQLYGRVQLAEPGHINAHFASCVLEWRHVHMRRHRNDKEEEEDDIALRDALELAASATALLSGNNTSAGEGLADDSSQQQDDDEAETEEVVEVLVLEVPSSGANIEE